MKRINSYLFISITIVFLFSFNPVTVFADNNFAKIKLDIEKLPPGHWYEVPNSKLKNLKGLPTMPGHLGSIMGAWSGGVFDSKRNRLVIWGGGNRDYSGNEMYAFDFDEFKWHRLTDPSPLILKIKWKKNHLYKKGDRVVADVHEKTRMYNLKYSTEDVFLCLKSGISGEIAPDWNRNPKYGDLCSDREIEWKNVGANGFAISSKNGYESFYYPTDGQPGARQTMQLMTYSPIIDSLVSIGSSSIYPGNHPSLGNNLNVDLYEFSKKNWLIFPASIPKIQSRNSFKSVTADDLGNIWVQFCPPARLFQYRIKKNQWIQRSDLLKWPGSDLYTASVIHQGRNFLIVAGYGKYIVYDLTPDHFDYNGYAKLIYDYRRGLSGSPPPGTQIIVNHNHPTLQYDSKSNLIVGYAGLQRSQQGKQKNRTRVFTLNIDTHMWTEVNAASENKIIPGLTKDAGTYGRWVYVPALNIFALINSVNENVFIYRLTFNNEESIPEMVKLGTPAHSSSQTVYLDMQFQGNTFGLQYLISESSAVPAPGDNRWTDVKPVQYFAEGNGKHTLYSWIKTINGKILQGKTATMIVDTDTIAPVVSVFDVAVNPQSFKVKINAFSASDNTGVTGYLITENQEKPEKKNKGWLEKAPREYTAKGGGTFKLYAWTRDAEGNISRSFTIPVTIDLNNTPGALRVGPHRKYKKISDAVAGARDFDRVEVDAGIYLNDYAIVKKNNLTIRGIGGFATMISDRKVPNNKGLLLQRGDNLTVQNLIFQNAFGYSGNIAGIRGDGGKNLTVRHCRFLNNENGILTGKNPDSDILIEHSEFLKNGKGNGQTHNVYIGHVNRLSFRFNYSHQSNGGQELKSRARENIIVGNRLMNESGNGNYAIDLPSGGRSYVVGNLIQQGPKAPNGTIINYGKEVKLYLPFTKGGPYKIRKGETIIGDLSKARGLVDYVPGLSQGKWSKGNAKGKIRLKVTRADHPDFINESISVKDKKGRYHKAIASIHGDQYWTWAGEKKLYLVNNTIVNDKISGGKKYLIRSHPDTEGIWMVNNIFVRGDRNTFVTHKKDGSVLPHQSNNLMTIKNPGFVDMNRYDYRLTRQAKGAIDKGKGIGLDFLSFDLFSFEYVYDLRKSEKRIWDRPDLGGFEYQKN